MSSNITLSAATRQNLLSLQDTASLLSTTQSRLSTGKKVNSALDNPTNFFTSQSLSSRSSDLSSLLDGLSNSVQTIQAANQGITSIQKLVDSAKSTASQALADKSGGKGTILGGVPAQSAVATGTAALGATYDLSSLDKDASLEISLDGVTKTTIRLDSSTLKNVTSNTAAVTSDQLVTAINGQIAASTNLAGKLTASVGTNGRLSFTTTDTGATAKLAVGASANAKIDIGFGVSTGTPQPAKIVAGTAMADATDFSNGKSSVFTISDGNKSVTVTLNANSATDAVGGKLGNAGSRDEIIAAINKQLSDAGSTITAAKGTSSDANKIVFTSQDAGPDAQLSINPMSNTAIALTGATITGDTISGGTVAATGLGFSTFTAAAGTEVQGNTSPGAKTTRTGTADIQTTPPSLAGGKSATFTINDNGTSKTITIDSTSLDTPGTNLGDAPTGTALGDSPTSAKILSALNAQLKQANSGVLASVDGSGKLVFSAAANGPTGLTVTAGNDTIGLGFGTAGVTSGAFTAGTGNAPGATAVVGTDASDGSSKASVAGTTPPTAAPGNYNSAAKTFDFNGSQNATFTVQLGTGQPKQINLTSTQFASSGTVTQASLAKAINDQINLDTGLSGKVKATFVNDKLTIQTTAFGSDQTLTVKAGGGTDIGFGSSGAAALTSTGTDIGGSKGTSSVRSTLAAQFNNILTQITQQAQDSGYNGINLLFRNSPNANENTLKVTFNEKGTSNLNIEGVKFDADGLGLVAATKNFQSDDEISAAMQQLTDATAKLRTQASTFGSNLTVVQNRQDFSKSMINILDTGSANLINADMNEEAANSQALSTRNSLAISALSLANQAQQGILQLLR